VKSSSSRTGKIAALVALAIYLIAGFALADEMVLCVAEDGRVSLEEAREGRCVNSHDTPCGESSGQEESACPSSPDDCCGTCLDFPISVSSPHDQQVPAAAGVSHDAGAQAGLMEPVDILTHDSPVLCADSPGVNPIARSTLKILRSTVIII